jgi:hypothetical protein
VVNIRVRVLGLRGKHQNRFYLKDRIKMIYWKDIILDGFLNRLGHRPT